MSPQLLSGSPLESPTVSAALMTQPVIPDLVLYRTIVDGLYRKALGREQEHVYFKRERLQQAENAAQQQAAQQVQWTGQYRMTSQRSFYNWLRFAQYRKHLLLQAVHPYLVVTDVRNFFDNLLHSHVEEGLRGLRVAPRMLGLLFFLLERLSIRQDYASSHAISLPVDEFDCSRTLAHMTLFSHDDMSRILTDILFATLAFCRHVHEAGCKLPCSPCSANAHALIRNV